MDDARCVVLVFSKTPIPGTVKTRLLPALDEAGVTELYESLIVRTLSMARQSGIGDTELWCWPTTVHPFLQECVAKFQISLHMQQGENLGDRMFFAFRQRLRAYSHVILIGCDCPTLTELDLQSAVMSLSDGADVVLSPAEDGGYNLIGLSAANRDLFDGIEWGSSTVLEVTRAKIDALGLHCVELEERWDLDEPADLTRYRNLFD